MKSLNNGTRPFILCREVELDEACPLSESPLLQARFHVFLVLSVLYKKSDVQLNAIAISKGYKVM